MRAAFLARARRASFLAASFLALAAAPAAAQRLGEGGGADIPVWRVVLALLFCLALGGAAILLLRRRYGGATFARGRARRLELVENLRLGHQVDVCIVRRDGQEYVLAAGPQGVTLVDSLPAAAGGNEAAA